MYYFLFQVEDVKVSAQSHLRHFISVFSFVGYLSTRVLDQRL